MVSSLSLMAPDLHLLVALQPSLAIISPLLPLSEQGANMVLKRHLQHSNLKLQRNEFIAAVVVSHVGLLSWLYGPPTTSG